MYHRKISNIRRTQSQKLNDFRLVFWVINNFIAYKGATYIRDLTVLFCFPSKALV